VAVPAQPKAAPAADPPYRGEDYQIEDSVTYLMRLALNAFKRRADQELRGLQMTGVQVLPLLIIARGLCDTAADYARLADSDPGATTRMIDRLQAKGLLRRVRGADDRRVQRLEVTPAGKLLAERIPYALAASLNALLRDFSAAELEQLKDMLRRIAARGEESE
jgi:DNA-binding MarR family transcriptional regulator